MKHLILLIPFILAACSVTLNDGGYSKPPPLSDAKRNVENYETGYVREGKFTAPKPPFVQPAKIVTSDELTQYMIRTFPKVEMGPLKDHMYAIPDYASALRLVGYIADFNWSIGNTYTRNGNDCDDFADDFQKASQKALWYYHPKVEAPMLCAKIDVRYLFEWAGIFDGYHELNAIPFINWSEGGEKNEFGIIVLEPQATTSTWCLADQFPNRAWVYRADFH